MDILKSLFERNPDLENCQVEIEKTAALLIHTFEKGGKLLVCGNGGSAADSEHIVGELMKGYRLPRPVPEDFSQRLRANLPEEADYFAHHLQGALPAISLVSQSALLSAFANDVAPDMVYAQQVYGYGKPGDALIALSTSGNSTNVVNAVKIAQVMNLNTMGFTNAQGGKLSLLCDVCIKIPRQEVPEVQELHMAVYHALCALLEDKFFG